MQAKELTENMAKHIEEMERLLIKYEKIESTMLVMDDYDGGQMHMVQLIIKDLRNLMWWRM